MLILFLFFLFNFPLFFFQKFQTVHDALLRRLYDDDLSVVQAVLSMGRLSAFIEHSDLLDAIQKVLKRCSNILISGTFPVTLSLLYFCSFVLASASWRTILPELVRVIG